MLRAYAKYLRQAKFDFTQAYLEDTLAAHPEITRQLVVLFRCLHDPDQLKQQGREGIDQRAAETIKQIEQALDRVTNLDEDRILRRFLNLVRATLRTNYFQKATGGGVKSYISFKLDSRAIDELPLPRPLVEIWVYSPRVEAVHLRGGKVARGGIRWSDRKEDFRTEILGLMKAQMVKNAVIVPVGSKGGFVVKNPPPAAAGRDALMAEVIECYKTMMRGLLDITDNLVAGKIVPPAEVVRLDGDDPYLVVAADKGTATFSDIANGVSQEYGFWLDDAFASGGSAGYDHKKMGITARGAWESVKRHFRELGRDIQSQDFTVIGVGDMSGDVFGNGMLLSRHIKLRAAFDHRHIFLDPAPDPAKSWAERKRMFDLPRSSWADYDKALISAGGGVFERSLKSIPLTDEVKAAFGIDPAVAHLTPTELMRRLLASETDLLWFGGIGTYVKASTETHAEVGDKANDGLRVDARDLKALVVGEGANLGFTQRGRVEAALHGRRINTDAIDNSAGVDTSDHEVNIKILLRDVMDRGQLTRTQRDQLLAQMTDEVGHLVLADNYKQTQALTVAEAVAPEALEDQVRVMRQMEKAGRLNRAIEFLPDDEQAAERAQAGRGLTRPELAVLLAYSKLVLYDKLLASELPDEPKMVEDLIRYFPQPLREKFAEAIGNHRLRREIIATVATNGMVNRVGPAFVTEMVEQTGMGEGDVARSYIAVREAFALRSQWEGIEALDNKVPAKIQAAMVLETNRLMRRTIPWLLVRGKFPFDVAAEAARLAPAVEALAGALDKVLPETTLAELKRRTEALTADGVPAKLARRIASLPILAAVTDIAHIAAETKAKVEPVAAVYFAVEDGLGFGWLRARAQAFRSDNHWQRQAAAALVEDLFALQGRLAERVMAGCEAGVKDAATAAACVAAWAGSRPGPVERVQGLLAELRAVASVDLSMLSVAARQLRGLVAG